MFGLRVMLGGELRVRPTALPPVQEQEANLAQGDIGVVCGVKKRIACARRY